MQRSIRVIFGAIIIGSLLTGCGSETEAQEPNPNYSAEIDKARNDATSEFERAALEDGIITKTEYDEAFTRFQNCVTDKGGELELIEEYGLYTTAVSSDIDTYDNEIEPACSPGTINILPMLYYDLTRNPNKVSQEDLIAKCFVNNNIVDPPFSGEDFVLVMDFVKSAEDFDPNAVVDPRKQQIFDSGLLGACIADPAYIGEPAE
jgi:hypothetical protein